MRGGGLPGPTFLGGGGTNRKYTNGTALTEDGDRRCGANGGRNEGLHARGGRTTAKGDTKCIRERETRKADAHSTERTSRLFLISSDNRGIGSFGKPQVGTNFRKKQTIWELDVR